MKISPLHKRVSLLFVAGFIVFTIAAGYYGRRVSSKAEEGKEVTGRKKSPEIKQEVYAFKVEGFSRDKKLEWGLEGESARVVFDKVNINNLKGIYHDEDMTFTIFADKAVYDKNTHDVELKENIVGKTSDGAELVTDYAKWDAKTEEIITDSWVIVRRENITCRGKGAVTKPRLKWATFRSEIEVDIAPEKKIFCSGPFEIDHEKGMAVFNNNVRIIDKTGEMLADKLTVFLDPDTNQIERIVTEGNVRVVHKGDVRDIGKLTDLEKGLEF